MREHVYYNKLSDKLFVWSLKLNQLLGKENYIYLGPLEDDMDEEEDKKKMAIQQINDAMEKIEGEVQVVKRCLTYLTDGY